MPSNPFFFSTSSEKPKILNISFESDPKAGLGAQLSNHDKGLDNDMFMPAYARIGRLLAGDTVARKAGVEIGDIVVAVNGIGFRRFPPDFRDNELEDVTVSMKTLKTNDVDAYDVDAQKLRERVISGKKDGEHYDMMLKKIKKMKQAADPSNALNLSIERYDWDSRVNSWPRFLYARNGSIPNAMKMMQDHEAWKASTFPIDLTDPGLQTVLKAKAVSEVSIQKEGHPSTVYVNFQKLQSIQNCKAIDVSRAFVIFTESLLKHAKDPRAPKTCQFIDLTAVSLTGGLRSDVLREVYGIFEPNYPETLHRMIMYPVSKLASSTARLLLNFVNENTSKKFVFTDDLSVVCHELGWNEAEVEEYENVAAFIQKHSSSSLVFD